MSILYIAAPVYMKDLRREVTDTDEDTCKELNTKFQSVFTLEDSEMPSLPVREEGGEIP